MLPTGPGLWVRWAKGIWNGVRDNAFNYQMQVELRELWRGLRSNDDVRAIVLTGAGDEAFCTGIDRGETIEESYLADEENRY
jgi:enoyl-CoA hydratase/carnithine racemase